MNLNSKTFPMPGSYATSSYHPPTIARICSRCLYINFRTPRRDLLRLLHHLQKESGSLLVVVMPISLDNLPAPPIVSIRRVRVSMQIALEVKMTMADRIQ